MNRRSILRLLGLAPIAAPVALAASIRPDVGLPIIEYAGLDASLSSQIDAVDRIQRSEALILSEAEARASADVVLTRRADKMLPFSFDDLNLTVPKLVVGTPPAA